MAQQWKGWKIMLKMRVSQGGRIMGLWFKVEPEKVDNVDYILFSSNSYVKVSSWCLPGYLIW